MISELETISSSRLYGVGENMLYTLFERFFKVLYKTQGFYLEPIGSILRRKVLWGSCTELKGSIFLQEVCVIIFCKGVLRTCMFS